MKIQSDYYSHIGRRPCNQDSAAIVNCQNAVLAVVADGLGGLTHGEVASRMAVDTLCSQLADAAEPDEDVLYDAIVEANSRVFAAQIPNEPMRTTIAALWLTQGTAIAATVGDTRIYQIRDGRIIFQSVDHSVAQMAVMVGKLRQEQVRSAKERNRLVRAVGDAEDPKADIVTLDVQPGDRFVLCSDGFWEPVLESDMLELAAQTQTPADWLAAMREIVEDIGDPNQDNHTAAVLLVEE